MRNIFLLEESVVYINIFCMHGLGALQNIMSPNNGVLEQSTPNFVRSYPVRFWRFFYTFIVPISVSSRLRASLVAE